MRNYQETEADIVVVIADIPVVDIAKTAVIGVTAEQTVTVSKFMLCSFENSL